MHQSALADPHEPRAKTADPQSQRNQHKNKILILNNRGSHCQAIIDNMQKRPEKQLIFRFGFDPGSKNER